ncbi:unnamed protein product [Brassicogethes aeneus]|uniref:Nose resistant-to-fluoxetine protein N-terminal domain-containing protein n=1 Tax=Brassicogethes aeneus TaxID=1431903 RepID=A0A9P0ARZ5_BRAAE|nr:unnamed protein product [Brassicogethes aeneus]
MRLILKLYAFSLALVLVNGILSYEQYANIFKINNDILVSDACKKQINNLDFNTGFTMFDASSKIIYPGLIYATPIEYGIYDECVAIDVTNEDTNILGKHCVGVRTDVSIPIGSNIKNVKLENLFSFNQNISISGKDPKSLTLPAIQAGYCVPNKCTVDDLNKLFEAVTVPGVISFNFNDAICTTKNTGKELDTADICVISLLVIILAFIIVSTTYDVIQEKNKLAKKGYLIAFSLYTNTKKLVHVGPKEKEQIPIFHGLKFISMMWVIAGHGFGTNIAVPLFNMADILVWMKQRYIQYITAAPLAVTTFFFISGFLLPFTYLKLFKGKGIVQQVKFIPMNYLHRYLRLTPAAAMVFLVTISIIRHLGSGPMFYAAMVQNGNICKNHPWSFFLYFQNYYNYDQLDICLAQTWYLSADMQMFWLSPLFLIPTAAYIGKKYNAVMMSLFGFCIVTIILPIVITFKYPDYTNTYGTHTCMCNYVVGFIFGTFMRENIDKPFVFRKNRSFMNLLVWIVTLLIMYAIVYITADIFMGHMTSNTKKILNGIMPPLWSMCLGWMVYSCFHGYGGVVNWILTRPILQVGSRLSYCIYLLHMTVLIHNISFTRGKIYFNDWSQFYTWCGYFIISVIFAFIWTLSFESPIIILEKVAFGGNKKTLKKEKTINA